jgi:hypothetical protein
MEVEDDEVPLDMMDDEKDMYDLEENEDLEE